MPFSGLVILKRLHEGLPASLENQMPLSWHWTYMCPVNLTCLIAVASQLMPAVHCITNMSCLPIILWHTLYVVPPLPKFLPYKILLRKTHFQRLVPWWSIIITLLSLTGSFHESVHGMKCLHDSEIYLGWQKHILAYFTSKLKKLKPSPFFGLKTKWLRNSSVMLLFMLCDLGF